jgi:hypothetical protein
MMIIKEKPNYSGEERSSTTLLFRAWIVLGLNPGLSEYKTHFEELLNDIHVVYSYIKGELFPINYCGTG